MKKLALLMAVIMLTAMIPVTSIAGKHNTVSSDWYYNDPEGTAYPLGVNDPQYSYVQPVDDDPSYHPPVTPAKTPSYSPETIGYLGYRTLKRTTPYMRGTDVKTLQMMLNALGYFAGRIDGIFGDRTKAAVKAFQRHNGLTADGIVGSKTRAKLLSKYRNRP